jgi:hypothetical protein
VVNGELTGDSHPLASVTLQLQAESEVSDIVAFVGPAADEQMLIHVAGFAA